MESIKWIVLRKLLLKENSLGWMEMVRKCIQQQFLRLGVGENLGMCTFYKFEGHPAASIEKKKMIDGICFAFSNFPVFSKTNKHFLNDRVSKKNVCK